MTATAKLMRSVFLATALLTFAPVMGSAPWLLGVSQAHAQTVSTIQVSGNVRVDAATVQSFLTIRPGQVATQADIASSTAALNASGLFESVSISLSGSTLVVQVVERASVGSVTFEGNQRFSDAQLTAMVNVANRGVYSREGLEADIQSIEAAYDQAGYSGVEVSTRTEIGPDGRTRVVFTVNEGVRTGIAAINFTGNNSIGAGQLKNAIRTKESHLLSWLFRDDVYDEDRLAVDRELIRLYYANRGFPDAQVLSAVAEFDTQRNAYFINFTIDEGERYSYGNVAIETSIPGLNTDALRGAVQTGAGNRYSISELQDSQQDLALRATLQGYPFAEVRPRIDRDIANHTFNITYLVDEGPRVYVERINITGNTKTRDFVIRREFDFAEGDPFNRSLVTRGRESIQALGFFSSVQVTASPGSAPDQVVLNVAVVEQSTGDYGVTAGYSSQEGLLGELSITERNFLGRGQYVRAAVGASESGQTFDLSFTEPRFMGLRVSAGFDVYRRIIEEGTRFSYGIDRMGGRLRFGLPLTDNITLTAFGGFESETYIDERRPDTNPEGAAAPPYIQTAEAMDAVLVGYTLEYNNLDNSRRPTEGLIASLSQQYIGLDYNLLRTEARARYYYPILEEYGLIGSIRGQAGIINDLGGDGIHPTQAFQLGPQFVRGFRIGGMGARQLLRNGAGDVVGYGDALGVTTYAGLSAEVEFPIPLVPETWGIRGAVWGDLGWIDGVPTVAGVDTDGLGDAIKSSVGASLIWDSPFGPLRGDFAHVIDQAEQDNTQVFQLTLSTLF